MRIRRSMKKSGTLWQMPVEEMQDMYQSYVCPLPTVSQGGGEYTEALSLEI